MRRGQFLQGSGEEAWADGTVSRRYGFRHTLYREVLYRRLGSARRQRWHRAIGARLEAGYGAAASQITAALAVHFERGRDTWRAVPYRQQTAEQARRRWVYQEASRHLRRGLELLRTLPDTPERAQHELALQITLGQGAAEVEQAYARARALCEQLGDSLAWRVPGLFYCGRARGLRSENRARKIE